MQSIFSSSFNKNPDEIKFNRIEQNVISSSFNLDYQNNTVELKLANQITDCSCMSKGCSNIYEIDITDFNASNILKKKWII